MQKIAFSFTKAIIRHHDRQEIKTLLDAIKYTDSGPKNYGILDQFANSFGVQFLSYLLVNNRADEFKQKDLNFDLEKLTDEDKKLLDLGHNTLKRAIASFTIVLQNISENLYSTANCYSMYDDSFLSSEDSLSIDPKLFLELEKSINENEITNKIRQIVKNFPDVIKIPQEQFLNTMIQIDKRVMSHNPFDSPHDIYDFFMQVIPKNPSQKEVYDICILLYIYRQIAANFVQLIFQAFFYDHLIKIDKNNTFNIGKSSSSNRGKFFEVSIQPTQKKEFSLNPGNIIFSEIDTYGINGLYKVGDTSINYGQDSGTTMTLIITKIDKNLVSFPGVYRI